MPCLPNRRQWHPQLVGSLLESHDPGGLGLARCLLIRRTPSSHSRLFQSTCRSLFIQFLPTSQPLLGLCLLSPFNVPGPCLSPWSSLLPSHPFPIFFHKTTSQKKEQNRKEGKGRNSERADLGVVWVWMQRMATQFWKAWWTLSKFYGLYQSQNIKSTSQRCICILALPLSCVTPRKLLHHSVMMRAPASQDGWEKRCSYMSHL